MDMGGHGRTINSGLRLVSCFRAGSLERRRREVVKALRAIREAMAGDMV